MDMDFSAQIKAFRQQHELSQDALAQLLAAKVRGKQTIDTGTISRWERQSNAPSLRNQLYLLRKLGIKATTANLHSQHSDSHAIELLQARYQRFAGLADKPYRHYNPAFSYQVLQGVEHFLAEPQLQGFNQRTLGFNVSTAPLAPQLAEVRDLQVYTLLFYHQQQLVSHLAYAIGNTHDMAQLLAQHYQSELSPLLQSEPNGKLLINFSAYASDFAIYLFSAKHLLTRIAADCSIDWYLAHSYINEDWLVQKGLGAQILLRGQPQSSGGIRIGKGRFKALLYATDASSLLASPLSTIDANAIATYGVLHPHAGG